MTYQFARIDLSQTNYKINVECMYMPKPDIPALNAIYKTYCTYKHFASVMPIFDARYLDPMTDVIGYYDKAKLVAFSLIRRFDEHNALCDQFAWTYHNPRLRMGIETMKAECAMYKARGFKYLYLEQAHLYKSEIDGFEILGPLE